MKITKMLVSEIAFLGDAEGDRSYPSITGDKSFRFLYDKIEAISFAGALCAIVFLGDVASRRSPQSISDNIKFSANLVQFFAMFNLSRDIQSLSSFKRNTSDFIEQMKQTRQPIVLTVNGKAEIVVQDAAAYQKLLDTIEYLETITGIKEGLKDVEAGQTYSLEQFKQEMQQKHGISS